MPGRRAPPDTANLKEIPYANESRVEMAGGVCGHGGPGFRHRRGRHGGRRRDVAVWISTQDGRERLRRAGSELAGALPLRPHGDHRESERKYQSILGLGSSWDHATCQNLFRLPRTSATR